MTKKRRFQVVLCVVVGLVSSVTTVSAFAVGIAAGDVEKLKTELRRAQNTPGESIVLTLSRGEYLFDQDDELPVIETDVFFASLGKGVVFKAVNGGPTTLFRVAETGDLKLTEISFEDFTLDLPTSEADGSLAGLVVNKGSFFGERLQFKGNIGNANCNRGLCTGFKPLFRNTATGDLRLQRILFYNNGLISNGAEGEPGAILDNRGTAHLKTLQIYSDDGVYYPTISNSGELWLRNATIKSEDFARPGRQEWILSTGRLQVSNSIIDGYSPAWCENVISAGYNLVDNPDCGITGPEDIVGRATGLRWQIIEATNFFNYQEQPTLALVPIAASPAIDSANDDSCASLTSTGAGNHLLDGDSDSIAHCDRGAVEISESFLALGGINGLFFNPEIDGHYVYVADTKFNTMVMWTTFDRKGDQAWVFGIAEKAVAGRSLIANAYINRNGRLSLSGHLDPAVSEHWGRLELDMTDCNHGTLTFFSDVPEFDDGTFEITRLAHVRRLGCSDNSPEVDNDK